MARTRPNRSLALGAIVAALAVGVVAFLAMDGGTPTADKRTGPTTVERLQALRDEEARRASAAADGSDTLAGEPGHADGSAGDTRDDTGAASAMRRERLADRQRAFTSTTGGAGATDSDAAVSGSSGGGSRRDTKGKRKRRRRDDVAGDIAVAPQASRHTILATEPDAPYDTQAQSEAGDLKDLDGTAGAVSFWLQPGWDQTSQDDAAFVTIGEGLRVYKNVNFLRVEVMGENGQKVALGVPINDWKPGEWHQVATSWGPEGLSLYLDGKVVSQNVHTRNLQFEEEPKLMVGTNAPPGRPIASGILADVRVRDRPLTPFAASRGFYKGGPPDL